MVLRLTACNLAHNPQSALPTACTCILYCSSLTVWTRRLLAQVRLSTGPLALAQLRHDVSAARTAAHNAGDAVSNQELRSDDEQQQYLHRRDASAQPRAIARWLSRCRRWASRRGATCHVSRSSFTQLCAA